MKSTLGFEELFDFSEIPKKTQHHLTKVYSFLSSGVLTALLTFFLCQFISLSNSIFILLAVASVVADIISFFISKNTTFAKKVSLVSFYGYALSVGGILGNDIISLDYSNRIEHYSLCLSSLVSSISIFIAFSIFSILTSNRLIIYTLVSISSFILSIISIFIFNFTRYIIIGTILASLYVIMDTQNIIHRNKISETDPIYDAKLLFVDLVKLFYKIYQYLQKSKEEKNKKEKKSK